MQSCEMCGYISEQDWFLSSMSKHDTLQRICDDPSVPFVGGEADVGILLHVSGKPFSEIDRKNMCGSCTDENTGEYLLAPDVIAARLSRANRGDKLVIFFVAFIMGWFA